MASSVGLCPIVEIRLCHCVLVAEFPLLRYHLRWVLSRGHTSSQTQPQGQHLFHEDRISFTFGISHPLEAERLFSGECKVHPCPCPPLMMEAVCFSWRKKNKMHIITHLFVSLSVPFLCLVHARPWDAFCPGERAELGSGLCDTGQTRVGNPPCMSGGSEEAAPGSACPLAAGEEGSLPHETPTWKICDVCPSSPGGDAPGRNPGLLRRSCLCRSPLLIQPRLKEIIGLHLIRYQKIPTRDALD